MRQFLFLLAVAALSSAAPGGYNSQSYHFNQESATFKDNELQHKNEESGQYSKFEDLDSVSPPQVQSSYQQSEYNAPGANSNRWVGVKGRPRMHHSHHQQQGTYRGEFMHENQDWRHQNADQQQTHDFGHHQHHGGHGRHRVYYQEEAGNTGFESQSHTLQQSSSSGSLYQHNRNQGGSGRDYWMRTEGQSGRTIPPALDIPTTTENIKPVNEPELEPAEASSDNRDTRADNDDYLKELYAKINQIAQMDMLNQQQNAENIDLQKHGAGLIDERRGQRPQQRSYNSEWTIHGQNPQNTQDSAEQETQTDDLTQQTQDGFDDITEQTQDGFEDLTQQSQSGFDDLTQQTQQTQDLHPALGVSAQQKDLSQQHEDLTQHTQGGFEFGSQHRDLSQQRQTGSDLTQQHEDLTQQTQDGFDKLEFGQQHEDLTQQTQTGFEIGSQQRDSSQHRQTGLDLTQQHEDLTQQTQDGFDKLQFGQQHEDLTQQTQTGFEIGSQQRDSSQQRQTGLDLTQQHEDLTQQTQDGFDKIEFGQQHEDLTQQTQTGFEIGSQQRDSSQQRQTGLDLTQQHEDLTQQTQDGFDKLEFGQQHEDLTQQTQTGFEIGSQQRDSSQQRQTGYGRLNQQQENLNQQHEDLTQQTQDGFGTLEFGQQHEDLTQQHQQTEDLTQQTQTGFELGSQQRDSSRQTGRVDYTQQHQQNEDLTQQHQDSFGRIEQGDLTQQTQDGFGQLESGSQYQQSQHDKDFTQQTQDGFGKLEKQTKEEGQFEFGQQHEDGLGVVGLQQGRTISQSHSNSYSHSSHQQQSNSGSYSRTLHYGQVSQIPPELTTQDLRQQHVNQQVAHEVQDVSQQVQKVDDLNLEEQKEFNHQSNQELLGRGLPVEEEAKVTEIEVETTPKPGFWKRVGSSISTTYENAKEKSKSLADKLKQNLG